MVVETSLLEREESALRVIYLPLQIPAEDDAHIVVSIVNKTPNVINIAEAVRSAICWADNRPCPSTQGGHWDGGAGLNPGSSTTRQFKLDDFAGAPRSGRHEMSVEILGMKSTPTIVEWRRSHEG